MGTTPSDPVEAERCSKHGILLDPWHKCHFCAPETVNHPSHYGGVDNPYETIKVIEAWNLGFNSGNAVKYIARCGKKPGVNPIEDLEKAVWYLQREIMLMKQP